MGAVCDNLSVGVLIEDAKGRFLLVERKKFPFGFAPVAGHIDDFISPESCAEGEVYQEVGLKVQSLTLLHEGRYENQCRREGGTHHYWYVYRAGVSGDICRSLEETKQVGWYTKSEIESLMQRTNEYLSCELTEQQWEQNPGLEPVWLEILRDTQIIPTL